VLEQLQALGERFVPFGDSFQAFVDGHDFLHYSRVGCGALRTRDL
jgi:hypothetical protein